MITGSVQINKGYYFLVFNMYNEYGKRKPKVVQSTYIGYEQVVKGKLCPYFKSKKIKLIDLRPRDIQDFINYLYKQKLKGSTIAHYTSNMNTALKEAVIAEIIPSNPIDRIESVKKSLYSRILYR